MTFVWFLGLLLLSTGAHGTLIPSSMEGVHAIEAFHTVSLRVGTPGRVMKLIVDFTSSKLLTSFSLEAFSASFKSTMVGQTDVVLIGGRTFRVVVGPDNGKARALGCATCRGVLGLGPGSKLWLYEQDATFTSGAVAMGEGIPAYERIREAHHLGRFDCLPLQDEVCAVVGRVQGRDNITVVFGRNSPKTQVPVDIFDEYVDGLNVNDNTDPDDWGDLSFVFPSNDGRDNKWKLRARDIVCPSAKGPKPDLLLEGSGDPNLVVLSRAAWGSMMFKRFWKDGQGQVVQWKTSKHASTYTLVTLVLVAFMYYYWTLDPPGAWSFDMNNPYWRVLADGLTVTLALLTLFVPPTWNALWASPEVGAYALFTLLLMIIWQLVGISVRVGRWKDLLGPTRVYANHFDAPPLSIGAHDPPARQQLVLLGESHPRIWVAQSLARETVVVITMLLLVMETRAETLGSFGTAGIGLLLLFTVFHYTAIALLMRTGRGNSMHFGWALFWVTAVYLVVATTIIVDIYVVGPFIARFVNIPPLYFPLLRASLYALVLVVAANTAFKRVVIEEALREKALSVLVGKQS